MIGLGFTLAGQFCDDGDTFRYIGGLITLLPVVPELLSIFENIKIMKTKCDTKQKDEIKGRRWDD
jgi:hypothetical protein